MKKDKGVGLYGKGMDTYNRKDTVSVLDSMI